MHTVCVCRASRVLSARKVTLATRENYYCNYFHGEIQATETVRFLLPKHTAIVVLACNKRMKKVFQKVETV